MAIIPVYRQQVRQAPIADTRMGVDTTLRRRASAEEFGASVGDGVQAVGRAVATASSVADRIAAEERQKAAAANLAKASAEATKSANDLQLEFEKHKLEEAPKARGSFLERHAKRLDEIAKGLGDDQQRAAFANWRAGHEVSFDGALSNRAYAEMERSYDLNDEVARGEMTRSIRINADPVNGEEGLAQIGERLASLEVINGITAKRKGLNAEQLAALNRADRAEAHAVVINSWNEAGHTVAAKAYFDKHKDELEPKARDLLTRALDAGTAKTLAQSKTAEIYSPDKTLEAMYGEADQIEDQQVQAEVKRRLDERDTLRRRAIDQAQDKAFVASYEKIRNDPRGFDALTAGELTAMGPDREQKLKSYATRRSKGEALPWQESKAVRYKIEEAAADPAQRQAFAKVNLLDYVDRLNEDDFNALAKLQKDVREGKNGSADWLNTREEKVNQAAASLGLDPAPYRVEKGKVIANPQAVAFRSAIMDEANRIAAAGKREEPNADDVQKAIDTTIMKKVRLNKWGTDPERVAATLSPEERRIAYKPLAEIPANHRAGIAAEFAKAGKEPNDDQIQRAYAAALAGDRALYDSILAGQ